MSMGKTKVTRSGEGGEQVTSRVDACEGCDKRVKVNSVQCAGFRKLVHKRCSGVKCSLKKVFSNVICVC